MHYNLNFLSTSTPLECRKLISLSAPEQLQTREIIRSCSNVNITGTIRCGINRHRHEEKSDNKRCVINISAFFLVFKLHNCITFFSLLLLLWVKCSNGINAITTECGDVHESGNFALRKVVFKSKSSMKFNSRVQNSFDCNSTCDKTSKFTPQWAFKLHFKCVRFKRVAVIV